MCVATAVGLAFQLSSLVGRWDLTVVDRDERYPSWIEVVDQAGSLTGRVQGRFGHATALSRIEITGQRFRLTWPDEGDPAAVDTQFDGDVTGNQISGTMREPSGRLASFSGRRAPALTRIRSPRFGPAVDLLRAGLANWRTRDASHGWKVQAGELVNAPPSSDLISRQTFGDFRLHVEVNVPAGGNSGIYLRGRYEVQVQDDHGRSPDSRRMGGIYGQVTPGAQGARPAGEWQAFDITLIGRRVTVVLNGTTMIDDVEIPGITGGAIDSDEGAPGPLMLQGDHSGIRYRNIRIAPALEATAAERELLDAELGRFDAQVRRDTAALRNFFGDDLVYIHSNALVESKEHFIESVATGRIQYDSLVPIRVGHRIEGLSAIGTGRVRVQARLNGVLARLELLFTTVHVRRQGRWRLVQWQSTRVP